ncbi:MAG TPA: transposase [Chitinophagaceae bacterium]|nr:transposase [Chitinophagaceae bacterium]
MEFLDNQLYHIYNRGNNQQQIFFKPDNYIYFLHKVRKFMMPYCDILAYCLMPNHFHFLISSDSRTIAVKTIGGQNRNVLSEGIRNLLQTYTKAINKQNKTTGSLFQQNTKSKCLNAGSKLHDLLCFHYIHQNPIKARLVSKMEDWEYSSFKDYCGLRNGTLCHKSLAIQLLDINIKIFYEDSYRIINDDDLKNIY